MFRRLGLAAALLVSCAALGHAQTADDIVSKTLAAQHVDKLKSVQTRRLTGTMSVLPMGVDAAIVIESKRPNKVRVTVTVQGSENVEAYDGESGWGLSPAQGKTTPEPLPPDELKALSEQADFDGELVDYKTKGHTVELIGKEPVQGTDAWKLKVTLKDGTVQYAYIDAEHYLPIKVEMTRTINGAPVKTETFLGDYKDEGGAMVAHSSESKMELGGTPFTQKIVIQKVELNVPIDDARFKMPVAK